MTPEKPDTTLIMLWTKRVSFVQSRPNTLASPFSGERMPARILIRVVFPAPLGPSSPKTSPSRTSRLMPSRAWTVSLPSWKLLYIDLSVIAWLMGVVLQERFLSFALRMAQADIGWQRMSFRGLALAGLF